MTRKKKILIALGVVVVSARWPTPTSRSTHDRRSRSHVEKIERRDLEAIVSASGKIQPKRRSTSAPRRWARSSIWRSNEGDIVKSGQPLLQIDPRNLETPCRTARPAWPPRGRSSTRRRRRSRTRRSPSEQAQDDARAQEGLCKSGLLARDSLRARAGRREDAQRTSWLSEQSVQARRRQRIKQEEANLASAKYDLNKVRIVSPIDGIVTRRNIEEGETAVVGTMNNAGTVLLTIADLSVIETEIEVDETDIPFITDRPAGQGHDRRHPGPDVPGQGHRGRQQPDRSDRRGSTTRATNFKVRRHDRRARCRTSARASRARRTITTATRQKVLERADSGDDGPRAGRRRRGQHRAKPPAPRPGSAAPRRPPRSDRAEAGPDAQGNRGRVRRRGRPGRLHRRSRPASPAKSTSRCSTASRKATRSSPGRSVGARMKEGDAVKVTAASAATPAKYDRDR